MNITCLCFHYTIDELWKLPMRSIFIKNDGMALYRISSGGDTRFYIL